MPEIKYSLINTSDGKIRWVDQRALKELLSQENWKLFPNPEKNYYYEFDSNLNKQLGQEAIPLPAVSDLGGKEMLEVIVL